MSSSRVRMVDVANAAGVSRTTASFVLNGRPVSIPEETRQRVLEAARQMGYHPNAAALALATGRTQRIGVVLNEPESFYSQDSYFSRVLTGVTRGAIRHGYNLLLHSAHYADWRPLLHDIQSGAADGVLLIGRYAKDPLAPALLEAGFPTICISFGVEHPNCYVVDCDNELGGYEATRHLIGLGHRRIAFIYPDCTTWGTERMAGALRAVRESGLGEEALCGFPWLEDQLPTSTETAHWLTEVTHFLRTTEPRPTAAVMCDEIRARKLVELLPEAGITVPDNLAVVCFNSTDLSARTHPPMTSVWQPLEEIGSCAVDSLVELVETGTVVKPRRRFPVRLDVRASCGASVARAVVRKRAATPAIPSPLGANVSME